MYIRRLILIAAAMVASTAVVPAGAEHCGVQLQLITGTRGAYAPHSGSVGCALGHYDTDMITPGTSQLSLRWIGDGIPFCVEVPPPSPDQKEGRDCGRVSFPGQIDKDVYSYQQWVRINFVTELVWQTEPVSTVGRTSTVNGGTAEVTACAAMGRVDEDGTKTYFDEDGNPINPACITRSYRTAA